MISENRIARTLTDLAQRRGVGRSFCPSEAARAVTLDWRPLLPRIRAVAATLPDLRATQKGADIGADTAKGAIRLSLRDG